MRHVAIIDPVYLDLILAGRKRVEARLMRNRAAPLGRVRGGDVVYFKAHAGGFGACAVVSRVDQFERLTPEGVADLFRRYNALVCGSAAYWAAKCTARYATLVHLADVRGTRRGPEYRDAPGFSPRSAWIVLGKRENSRRRAPGSRRGSGRS